MGVVELSQKLGINRISLFRIEKGQRQPSEQTAIEALKILGLSEESIYHIFVLNDLIKRGAISKDSMDSASRLFLQRLKKKDGESTILHRYFQGILHAK